MATESVGFGLAFLAGLLSFLSPCVLPLIPSYVSFLTGLSFDELGQRRWLAVSHALLFVTGFTLIFVLLGASATAIGRVFYDHKEALARLGGALIVLFGLYLLGAFQWAAFARERRFHLQDKPLGYLGSMVVGIAFGAGWTPCIGPVLGSIMLYAGTQASVGQGIALLFAYSLGLAVPFLVAAYAVERFIEWFKKFRRFMPLTQRISGAVLLFVGLLLASGYFSLLAGWLQGLTPDFLRSRL